MVWKVDRRSKCAGDLSLDAETEIAWSCTYREKVTVRGERVQAQHGPNIGSVADND